MHQFFENLRISSFNCKNVKTSVNEIQYLCDLCDVLLLQETWLYEFDLNFLNSLHKDFYAKGISSMDASKGIITGRPHGGMAVLWRKTLGNMCKIVDLDDNRLLGLEINSSNISILIVNIYMSFNSVDNQDEFHSCLASE